MTPDPARKLIEEARELKPIPGYPAYFARRDGSIWSMARRRNEGEYNGPPRLLKPLEIRKHEWRVALRTYPHGRWVQRSIGRIILLTFVGPCPKGMWACHGPLGRDNHSLANLYYASPYVNAMDKLRDGTMLNGERHWKHKVNELQVRVIKKVPVGRKRGDVRYRDLVEIFGISKCQIGNIRLGRYWKHLESSLTSSHD